MKQLAYSLVSDLDHWQHYDQRETDQNHVSELIGDPRFLGHYYYVEELPTTDVRRQP